MLDIVQKHSDILKLKFSETMFDEKYKFFHGRYVEEYKSSDTTWNIHEFVSINKCGEVIGYISYEINRNEYSVSELAAINFSDNKITFGMDLIKVIKDVFTKFNFRKLSFGVFVGNPIEKSYDRLTLDHGGRIVGVKKQETRLMDGKFYDYKIYEILKEDFEKRLKSKKEFIISYKDTTDMLETLAITRGKDKDHYK